MYCHSCGTKLAQTLSYCYHCGANLPIIGRDEKAKEKTIDTVMWVIVGTTITLLGMALGTLVLMKDGDLDPRLGSVLVILSFVAFVLVESVLVWRLLRLNKSTKETRGPDQLRDSDREVLDGVRTRVLSDPGEPLPSVTEHTTRALEPLDQRVDRKNHH